MVEGPGCKLKGESLKKRVCGQTVKSVNSSQHEKSDKNKRYHVLSDLRIDDVKTLGKELFIFFDSSDSCLRIHFLMNGSIRYNSTDLKKTSQKIELHLSSDVVYIFESCVDIRSSTDCYARINALHTVDICSPSFNFLQATELVKQREEKMVCDAIMDQDALPGVGNIIKNESLFNSGIDPRKYIKQLTSEQIVRMLHRLRDFSALFYKCRKEGSNLARHYRVYGKQQCAECKGRLTVCKPGDLRRVTYFCPACQGGSGGGGGKVPGAASGSLLGYFAPQRADDVSWECAACTLLNKQTAGSCAACSQPRSQHPRPSASTPRPSSENVEPGKAATGQKTMPTNSEVVKCEFVCSGHNLPCIQKKVTKEGANRGRPFFVCRLPKAKQCVFFKWGDDNYPRCRHDKTTVLRSVLKVNSNNGKQFFCCPQPKSSQCDFFQWA